MKDVVAAALICGWPRFRSSRRRFISSIGFSAGLQLYFLITGSTAEVSLLLRAHRPTALCVLEMSREDGGKAS